MTAPSRRLEGRGPIVNSVQRTLSVLELLAGECGGGLGVSQIAERLNLSASTTHRILRNVQSRGYVAQDPRTRLYRLGPKVAQLGAAFVEGTNLRSLAYPHLRALADATRETANLAVLAGMAVVKVLSIDSPYPARPAGALLCNETAHASALGKVLLAALPEAELTELIARTGLQRLTERTITSCRELVEALAVIREQGYALDVEESWEGVCCVGAPIRNCYGQVVAAAGIVLLRQRFGEERLPGLIKVVMETADAISHELGYVPRERSSKPG